MSVKNIFLLMFVVLSSVVWGQDFNFADFFEDATMRIDYFHTANAKSDIISIDQIYVTDTWAGNPNKLLPTTQNGRYAVKVYDIASNTLIYSKHYLDIVFEYKGTEPSQN